MSATRTIPFARPWITDDERRAVMDVLQGNILTHGPQCKGFEEDFARFLGADAHCVSMSSCMAALHMAYFHFGIGPGDEVIVPAMTHTATVHAVELVGARPVFVDCDLETGNMDPAGIERARTPRTKAISVVHFLGIPCDLDLIKELAARHNLKLIEDCALAVGSRFDGKHVGLWGDAGCFSFYPVKHITTGEGGMFVSRHKDVADSVARQRAFGVDRSHSERKIPGMYDVVELGLNYRMSEMQAALGRQQVLKIGEIIEQRRRNFHRIKALLARDRRLHVLDSVRPEAASSFYCLGVVLRDGLQANRDELVRRLNERGVGTSIYYPHPVSRMTYYRNKYGYNPADCQHAAAISDGSVALPVGPHLADEDVEYIGTAVLDALKEIKT